MENFKKLIALLTLSMVIFLSQASFILAGTTAICGACDKNDDCASSRCVGGECQPSDGVAFCNPSEYGSFTSLIQGISDFVFKIGIIAAPLMIAIGAFIFTTSAGDPKRTSLGKSIILWAAIGLGVLLFSKAIISLIKSFLGA